MSKSYLKLLISSIFFLCLNLQAQVFLSENFNLNTIPSGWTVEDSGSGPARWMIHAPAAALATMNGSNFLFVNSDSGGSASSTANESIISPLISAAPGQPLFLSFSHFFRKRINRQDTGRIEVFHNGSWKEVFKVSANAGLAASPVTEKIDISNLVGPELRIRLRYKSLRGWYWAIEDIKVSSPYPADIGVSGFSSSGCGVSLPFRPVVWLKNFGSAAQNNFPVLYKAAGQTIVSESYPDSLLPGDSVQFTFSQAINSVSSSFELLAWTGLNADSNRLNDSAATTINLAPSGFPTVEFTNFDGVNLSQTEPGWQEWSGLNPQPGISAWGVSTAAEAAGLGSVSARINLYSLGKREWMVSPAFSPDSAASLRYQVAVTNWNTPDPDQMGSDDSLIVKVSTDCGESWQNLAWYTVSDALPNQLTEKSVSLAAYQGQTIRVAFYGSEGSVDDLNDYDFHVDKIRLGILSANDLQLSAIEIPGGNCGAPPSFPVRVKLINSGSLPQTSAPISYQISGQNPVNQTFPLSLPAGADTTLEFTELVNAASSGNYSISAWVSLPSDANPLDDSVLAVPFTRPGSGFAIQTFTAYNGDNLTGGWQEFSGISPELAGSSWANPTAEQVTGLGSETARVNLYTATKKEWIISPAFSLSVSKSLKFKLAVTDWTNPDPATMGSDDSLVVKITTNCGQSWQNLRSFTASDNLSNSLTEFTIPLSTFIGQTVRIAFFATEGSTDDLNDYDVHIDDIELLNLSPTDVGLTSLIIPSAECGLPSSLPVKVKLVNFGTQAQSGFGLNYSVNGGPAVSGVYSNSLAPGEIVTYEFSQPADISQPGSYVIRAWTSLAGDQETGNDSLASEPLSPTPIALPPVDFSGYNGTNLTTISPGWQEKSGHEPTGTTSFWNVGTASQTTGLGSTAARVGILGNARREWLISPGFRPAPQTELRFKIALTSINFSAPGSLGSDDSLKVLISTNCGQSWEILSAFTAQSGLSNALVEKTIDLTAYEGQSCQIGFKATSGSISNTQSNDIHLDDIQTGPLTTSAYPLQKGKSGIRLFPNPVAGGLLTLDYEEACGRIHFYSVTGKEVFPVSSAENKPIFDVMNLPSGLYFIRSETGQSASFIIP